jgi:DNA-binding NarL/FixJ family response regulator
VAELAAAGLTTPEIAERLVVSPNTVGTHLTNVYRKLGVHERAGLAAALAGADAAPNLGVPGPKDH